jgi:hypothetical protein
MASETDISRSQKMMGNDNARKGKLFYGELRKTLVQNDALKLRQIAEKLVADFSEFLQLLADEVYDSDSRGFHCSGECGSIFDLLADVYAE